MCSSTMPFPCQEMCTASAVHCCLEMCANVTSHVLLGVKTYSIQIFCSGILLGSQAQAEEQACQKRADELAGREAQLSQEGARLEALKQELDAGSAQMPSHSLL
jgi:hypothetical protein